MIKTLLKAGLVFAASVLAPVAAAQSYYPAGPQTDVPLATVQSGGWSLCAQQTYDTPLFDFPAACDSGPGVRLMLACRATGSDTIQLLAAAPAEDVLFETGDDSTTTNTANGSEWYYEPSDGPGDGEAMGFARAGDSVSLNSCDTDGSGAVDERLCFHITPSDSSYGGYRCGTDVGLNSSTAYERLFFQTGSAEPAQVPAVPLAGLLVLGGLLGLFGLRKLRA